MLISFSKRILLDESPSCHSPGVFSHANRAVKKFSGGVFLVQTTGAGRVSGDILGQLKVVIGNLQLVEGIPKLLGVESTLHQAQLKRFSNGLGFLSVFRLVIAGLGIGKTGAPSRVQVPLARHEGGVVMALKGLRYGDALAVEVALIGGRPVFAPVIVG